jgi:hypothetical protein
MWTGENSEAVPRSRELENVISSVHGVNHAAFTERPSDTALGLSMCKAAHNCANYSVATQSISESSSGLSAPRGFEFEGLCLFSSFTTCLVVSLRYMRYEAEMELQSRSLYLYQ